MASSSSSPIVFLSVFLLVASSATNSNAQLTPTFYSTSCPQLLPTVQSAVQTAVNNEARMGASLLRLFFHDCFVNGCDASILLADTANFTGEQNALPNKNSLRGFSVIDTIKSAVEKVCPGIVSCADILALSARDSVVALKGPTWSVKLGRRDVKTASLSAANTNIPAPSLNLTGLISNFASHGLTTTDLVALSGAHTIGQARCITFRPRIYNEGNIDSTFAQTRQSNCPSASGNPGDNNLAPLDVLTPIAFNNDYYKNLVNLKGLLHSDQQLFSGGSTNALVQTYSTNSARFNTDFVAAIIKMGDISPLTGTTGEVRTNCAKTN